MAFPVVQSVGTGSAASGNNTVITKPTGLAEGDLMIAGVTTFASTAGITPPAGWTALETYSDGAGIKQGTWYKIAASGDVAASNFTFSDTKNSNTESSMGFIARISGYNAASVFNGQNSTRTASASTSYTDTGVTPDKVEPLLLLIGLAKGTASVTASTYAIANSNPSWTEVVDQGQLAASGSNRAYVAMARSNWQTTPGTATGTATVTYSGSLTNGDVLVVTLALSDSPIEPAPVTSAGTANTPTFVRRMVVAAIAAASTVNDVTTNIIEPLWNNVSKSTASWLNQNKS